MKQLLFITVFIISILNCIAQKTIVTGKVTDTSHHVNLEGATISLINSKDSSLVSFVRSDSSGAFIFRNVIKGTYRLSASFTGFHPSWKVFRIINETQIDLGEIFMRDKSVLSDISVESEKPPVSVNGDTLEFNAGSFNTKPNAVVEDLLKKLPGVQVEKDGTVRVNGQVINRIFVNGKEFFTGDPKLATRNLPADAVDKVQVFEKKSDQSEFTGFNDGNSQTAINLKLKKDKKNPTFGKFTAGAGGNDYYESKFNLNRFKGDQQVSAIGMANNVNKQGFSILDVLNFTGETSKMMKGGGGGRIVINNGSGTDFGLPVEGGGASSAGIARTIAGGVNFNDTWNKKTDFNGSYFYNNVNVTTNQQSTRQNILPSAYNYLQNTNANKSTVGNRVNFSYDHRIDSFNSIKISPVISIQQNKSSSSNIYHSTLADGTFLNSGTSASASVADGSDFKNNILFRHKFAKKGRTFSSNISMVYNNTRSNGLQSSSTNFFSGILNSRFDTVNQQNHIQSITKSINGNVVYSEPLSKKTLLEVNAFYGYNSGDLTRNIFDFNNVNGKYDNLNHSQSNAFLNGYQNESAGISLRHVEKKSSFSVGANLQIASLVSKLKDSSNGITKHFINVLPSLNYTYNFTRMKTLKLDYNSSTTPPTTSQLLPVPDSSDRLNIVIGNPELKQQIIHNASLQFFTANPALQKNLMLFGNFSYTQNAIVNADVISSQGIRSTHPVNASGVFNGFATIDLGFRLKKLNTRINAGGTLLYTNNVNYIDANRNNIGNTSYTPRLSLNYSYKDKLDITAESRISFNDVRYSYTGELNNRYTQQRYSFEANASLPWDISLNSEIDHSINSGRSAGYNSHITLWNVSVSKQVLKSKKGEFKFSVNDILNQNIGISRNANQNYVEDISYKTVARYYLVSFTYSLLKAGSGGPRVMMRTF